MFTLDVILLISYFVSGVSVETSPHFLKLCVSFAQKIGSGCSSIQTYFLQARTPTSQSQKRVTATDTFLCSDWLSVHSSVQCNTQNSNCKTRQYWSDMNQDSVTASSASASNILVTVLAVIWDCLWSGSHVFPASKQTQHHRRSATVCGSCFSALIGC